MKLFTSLLVLCFLIQEGNTFTWTWRVQNETTLYGCWGKLIQFPFLFSLGPSEKVQVLRWYIRNNRDPQLLGIFTQSDGLRPLPDYKDRVALNMNGWAELRELNTNDSGNYFLDAQTSETFGPDERMQISLVVLDKFRGNKLEVKKSDDMVASNSNSGISLTCGDFIFKNNVALLNVEWITPDGSVKNSTKFKDGKFYLQLDHPVRNGKYVCRIPEKYFNKLCTVEIHRKQASLEVNEVDTPQAKVNENKGKEETSPIIKICDSFKNTPSGIRTIRLPKYPSLEVYCDQETDGGGWTVINRRVDGSGNFDRGWVDYREGFGNLNKEFWLGLEPLHEITTANKGQKFELRFDLQKREDGSKYYAIYDDFWIGSQGTGYVLHIGGYKGNAGNSLYHYNGMEFTTRDEDRDRSDDNCAKNYKGGWWYKKCGRKADMTAEYKYLTWLSLTGWWKYLKGAETKFRTKQ